MSPPVPSGLSMAGQILRNRLKTEAFAGVDNVDVMLGTPAEAAKKLQPSTPRSIVNLFFYRVEPSGFFPDAGNRDRWFVRIRCLITVFSSAQPEQGDGGDGMMPAVPEGELDLRLLGEILRYFHEFPTHSPRAGETLEASLQVVFAKFTSEEINQIWSTQGDTIYRPSVAYEIALVPIEPREFAPAPTPVAAGGARLAVDSGLDRAGTLLEDLAPPDPTPPAQEVDTDRTGWLPALAFVSGGRVHQGLTLSAPAADASVSLWIAGAASETVTLVWRRSVKGIWQRFDGEAGGHDTTIPAQAAFDPRLLDPTRLADAALVSVSLPSTQSGQYLLHAERTLDGGRRIASYPLILTISNGGGA